MTIEKIHPLEGGYLRRKVRRDRRPGMPIENPLIFYPRYALGPHRQAFAIARIVWRMGGCAARSSATLRRASYRDEALTPVSDAELDDLEMFNVTASARAAAAKTKQRLASV